MPVSCIGALSYYEHTFVDYLTLEEVKRVMEATAAGAAIYNAIWKPFKKLVLSVIFIIVASASVTKLESDAAMFAHRMRPCLYQPAPKLPSPEPEDDSPDRDASQGSGIPQASTCAVASHVISLGSSPT